MVARIALATFGLQGRRRWPWRSWPSMGGGVEQKGQGDMSAGDGNDFVYDEATGEWISADQAAAAPAAAAAVEVRDSVGNRLADGDAVTLIKDLKVKGAGQVLKRGTVIRSIRLTGDAQEIDCRHESIKGLVLRAEFVKKN